jgi:hypothetical protein
MEKEVEGQTKEYPVTNSTFNEVREYQSHVQDGRGGGKPIEKSMNNE